MPTLTDKDIHRISYRLLCAAGALEAHAETVARHLADANLAGHDSHGFIRIIQYVRDIREGKVDPKAQPVVTRESGSTAQVNGNGTFGQVVATMATQVAIERAREYGISFVTMGNLGHTGRVGAYPETAAKEGMAAIMCTAFVGGRTIGVAPFGGRKRKMGTNPIAMSFPYSSEGPILLDFATSMAAEGKLRVYRARGKKLPDDWVLTKEGVPSRDPNDYYDGGSILPMGGMQGGHKGYALSFMVALLGPVLGDLAWPELEGDVSGSGSSIMVIDLARVLPTDELRHRVENVVQYTKDTPAIQGSSGVLYPGEVEVRSRKERLANGVPVEDATWEGAVQLIEEYGLTEEPGLLPVEGQV